MPLRSLRRVPHAAVGRTTTSPWPEKLATVVVVDGAAAPLAGRSAGQSAFYIMSLDHMFA